MSRISFPSVSLGIGAFLILPLISEVGQGQSLQEYLSRTPWPGIHIVREIDNNHTIVLKGNTHPLANSANDRGPVPANQPMRRMLLLLSRSNGQEAALDQLLADQQNPRSPLFHQWLTPQQYGASFGPSAEDISAVTNWLTSQGFNSITLNEGRTVVAFTGTAAQVQNSFHTAIHRYEARGRVHIANQTDPSIPAALSPVVKGVVSLNNFGPRSMAIPGPTGTMTDGQFRPSKANHQFTLPEPTEVTTWYWLSPYDFATIYDLLPLWNAGLDGTGQTIAIVGQTDINLTDAQQFRAFFGLPVNTPTIVLAGTDPGFQPDEVEADLDVEWSGAVARGANVELVSAASTETTAGVDLAALYTVDNNLAPVMSESYGECEMFLGTTANAFEATMWQQAAAQGITVLVSSGDQGSAACDPIDTTSAGSTLASHPMAVNGLASTPYNVAVGGTDFNQSGKWTQYWSPTNDPVTKQSVLGYIPEVPWNDSCGSTLLATLNGGDPVNWCGNTGLQYEDTIATSGGPSSCIGSNGTDASTCTGGWPKPAWQTGLGVPSDGVRDVPDVSFFASNNVYNTMYITCEVDLSKPPGCDPTATAQTFNGFGGTSASAPAMAGVMAIINQKYGRQGNANYTFYRLATSTNAASIFHDITTDGNRVACLPSSPDCEIDPTTQFPYGRLKGHDSTVGYDMVTGLGSVDVANLVNNWSSVAYTPTQTTLNLNGGTTSVTAMHGTRISAAVAVTATSGTPTGDVSLLGNTTNGSLYLGPLQSGSANGVINTLPGGSYSVAAHYAGDAQFAPSDSSPVSVSISPEPSTTKVSFFNYDQTQSAFIPIPANVPYGSLVLLRADVKGASGFGNATGSAAFADGSTTLGKFALNAQGYTETAPGNLLLAGTHAITASYGGNPSFNASNSAPNGIIVTAAPMTCNLFANTTFLRPGWVLVATPTTWIYQPKLEPPQGSMVAPMGTFNIYSGTTLVSGPTAGTGTGSGSLSGGAFQIPGMTTSVTIPASLFASNAPITVTYSGDSNYAPCTSQGYQIPYETNLIVPQVTLTLPETTVQGTPITASVIIASSLLPVPYEPSYPTPTGTFQIAIDGISQGSPIPVVPVTTPSLNPEATAAVTLPTTSLAAGMHSLTETYGGDANYQPFQQAGINFFVVVPDFSISTSTNTLSVVDGQTTSPVSLEIGASNGFTGTISFSCSGLPSQATCVFQPATVTTSGSTSLTISTTQAQVLKGGESARIRPTRIGLAAGLGGISAALLFVVCIPRQRKRGVLFICLVTSTIFLGVASCGGGSAGSSSPPPSPNSTFTSLVASSNTPSKGTSDTFTATVTANGSNATPTGTVQFNVDGTASGTPVTLSQGSAQFQTSFSTAGSHIVTAAYSGDGNDQASTSGQVTVTVPYSTGTLPGTYSVTITATSDSLHHTAPLLLQVN
jgi:hypothetical protein